MKWNCTAVRRRLSEYYDGELTIDQRVIVQEHLRACVACDAEARTLISVGGALRAAAAGRASVDDSRDLDGLAAGVLSRFRAEREESLSHTVQRMFEDLHLVWAALGATAATFVCLAITVGIFYFSRAEHPDSLAALIGGLSDPGSDAHPMRVDDGSQVILPRQLVQAATEPAVPELLDDEEIMLDTTITREGRVDMASLQLMNPEGPSGKREEADWKTVGGVLDSVAQARFAPARVGGEPVAVKMFWYVTHMTVRPKIRGHVHHDASTAPTHTV